MIHHIILFIGGEIMKEFIPLASLDNQFGINEDSQIINFKTGHILTPYLGVDMYQHVVICKDGRKIRI